MYVPPSKLETDLTRQLVLIRQPMLSNSPFTCQYEIVKSLQFCGYLIDHHTHLVHIGL
jgi:hypothetical protein